MDTIYNIKVKRVYMTKYRIKCPWQAEKNYIYVYNTFHIYHKGQRVNLINLQRDYTNQQERDK